MLISFVGAPGSGKGTQAKKVGKYFGLPHISIGDLLRREINEKSTIGLQIIETLDGNSNFKGTIKQFEEIASNVIFKRLEKDDCINGAILDGFPRTLAQAEYFLSMKDKKIKSVIHLKCEKYELLTNRIEGRLICTNCESIYNLTELQKLCNHQSKYIYTCNLCKIPLSKRKGDYPIVYDNRLEEYNRVTKTIIPYFKTKRKLIEVDGTKDISTVFEEIISKLHK